MVDLPGVVIVIKGDSTQLKKDMAAARQIVTESAKGISDSLNNALSADSIKRGTNALISNLGQLSRSSEVLRSDFNKIGVDLRDLQKITGTTGSQFQGLQARMMQVQGAKAQEKALRDIATAANLTSKEVSALGKQFGVSHANINRVVASLKPGTTGFMGMASAAGSLVGQLAFMVGGMYAGQAAITAIAGEFKRGLQSVEDFNLTVAASAAYITTFSEKAKGGDLAGAFIEANEYAGQLATKLEMIDSKTIASGKDLQTMSETFIQHGVLLDINNAKQVQGFTNIATALALVTAGQNKDIQMRQEINALLMGQIRATDRLPKLLSNIDPHLKDHLELWKKEGTLIENVGKLLEGFSASTGNLDSLWATVGSTMETIHTRILRGAMKPIFEDLIGLAKDLNQSLMDTEGNLTPLAIGMQKLVSDGYQKGKDAVDAFDTGVLKLIYDWNILTAGVRIFKSVVGGLKGAIEDFGSSDIEKAGKQIEELKEKLSGDKKWWEFSFLPDPKEERRRKNEIEGEISSLQEFIKSSESDLAELRRKSNSELSSSAPKITQKIEEETEKEIKARSRAADKAIGLLEDIEKKTKQVTLSSLDFKKWSLDQEIKEMTKNAAGNKAALDQIAEYKRQSLTKMMSYTDRYNSWERAQLEGIKDSWQVKEELRVEGSKNADEDIKASTTETTSVIISEWSNAFGSVQSSLADMIYEFDFSMDSILEIFKKMLAEMLAAIVMSGLKNAFLSLFSTGSITGMGSALLSGISSAVGIGGVGTAASAVGGGGFLASLFGGGSTAAAAGVTGSVGTGVAGAGWMAGTGAGVGGAAATSAAGAGTSGSMFSGMGGTMGAAGTFAAAVAGVVALTLGVRALVGEMPRVDEELARWKTSAIEMTATGLGPEMQYVTGAMRELVPALANVSRASWDAETATLTTVGAMSAFSEAAAESGNALGNMTYTFNAATGTWIAGIDAMSGVQSQMDSLNGSMYAMADTTSMAAGVLAESAGSVQSAFKALAGADMGALGSHLVGPSNYPGVQLHATGGIISSKTQWGSHILGESGPEGIIPLPDGPDTLSKIIDRLDRIEARQGNQIIVVNIAGTEVKRVLNPMIDTVVAARQSAGVTGRAYI